MRTRGTGSIIEKSNSRFLSISYYDANGKQRQESCRSESRSVAEELLRKRLEEIAAGVQVHVIKKLKYEVIKALLITDYRTRSVGMLEVKDGQPYVWGFEHLDGFFAGKLVKNITTQLLRKFIEKRQGEGAGNATINRNLALLRKMMNVARQDGVLTVVPFFPMLQEDNVRQGFVESTEFVKVLGALPEGLRPLITFLYYTGCRVGAARKITWSMV